MTNQTLQRQQAGAKPPTEVLDHYSVSADSGLSNDEVRQRQEQFGANRLEQKQRRSAWKILIEQFKSPIIGLLAAAAVLAFAFQEWIEGVAVIIAILLNTVIGFVTELRAVRSMEALQKLSKSKARVRRGGDVQEISAEELVPGDILVLDSGDLIPADARLLEASKLQVDESPLTGESLPVTKTTDPIDENGEEVPLADQKNMVFKGTAITRGSGEAVVVAIGMKTELGHISELTQQAEEESTPLEKRLDQLGRRLIWVTLLLAVVIAIAGVVGGKDTATIIKTSIALAVGAVPEGLPIVATVALARGMRRMADRNALINRLSAVETLGATSVICTDKTGTLTENRMTVRRIVTASGDIEVSGTGLEVEESEFNRGDETIQPQEDETVRSLLEVGLFCNNAAIPQESANDEDKVIGDPMEVALLVAGAKADLWRHELVQDRPEEREVAFDPDLKMMATVHHQNGSQNGSRGNGSRGNGSSGGYYMAVKGAPEAVLANCSRFLDENGEAQPLDDNKRKEWRDRSKALAEEGLRILAFAQKTVQSPDAEPYEDLTLLGVVGLLDPPRQDVKKAIRACHEAGVRVIMVTGDQPITARNVGKAVGLVGDQDAQAVKGKELRPLEELDSGEQARLQQASIFARVSPEQKLNLIALHQKDGAIVAMTGDGVNDAPALKKADIGVAMGQRGTQVAREASDMVLQDDAFSTIVAAIEQGRAIFRNIRKFTVYLLSGNMGEIIAVAVASLLPVPLPLTPLQILFINAINDVFPALALGVGPGNPGLMHRPPRKAGEAVLRDDEWWAIGIYGLIIALTGLGALFLVLRAFGFEETQAVTVSFLTLTFARLWHVFNMRDDVSDDTRKTRPLREVFNNEVTRNRYIWGALLICSCLLTGAVYLPGLSDILELTGPGLQGWGVALGFSVIPLVLGQSWKVIQATRQKR
ncbi:MAG: cation-transporting P-type ATPase [Synechococcales bacterium]|nr:cation-transporting P-type ATPase [Synechococcales bacterium]